MKIKNLPLALAQGAIALAVLSGCGGGGDDSDASFNTSADEPASFAQHAASEVRSELLYGSAAGELTTQELTTEEITTQEITTQEITTQEIATQDITTEEFDTTSQLALSAFATGGYAAAEPLTTTAETDRAEMSTEEFSSEEFATDPSDETAPGGVDGAALVAPITLDNWANFYNTKYKAYAFELTSAILHSHYDRYRYFSNPSLPVLTLAEIRGSQATMTKAVESLDQKARTIFAADVKRVIRRNASLGWAPFTLPELDKYLNGLLNHSHAQINYWLQHHQRIRSHVEAFFASASHATQARRFLTLRADAEATHDKRFLKGLVDDSVEDRTGTDQLEIELGNKRTPVERADLIQSRSMFSFFKWTPTYTPASIDRHGKNQTSIEPDGGGLLKGWTTKSDAYILAKSQQETLNYYIDWEVAKNGNLTGHNADQTRRNLRGKAEFLARETGWPYESFLAAQFIARTAAQTIVAATRMALYDKAINLDDLAQTTMLRVMGIDAIAAMDVSGRARLRAAVGSLIGMTVGQHMLSVLTLQISRYEYNSLHTNSTNAEINEAIQSKLKIWVGRAMTATTAASLGLLELQDIGPTPYKASLKKWIPGGFALADMTAGISDLIVLYRAGSYSDGTKAAQITGALVRMANALYTVDQVYGYKCFSVTYKKLGWNGFTIAPLKFTSYGAAAAAGFYMMGAAAVGFGF